MTFDAVPAIGAPPFGVIAKAEPGTDDWVWSRFADHVIVTVVPSEPMVAVPIVTAVVFTTNERIEL